MKTDSPLQRLLASVPLFNELTPEELGEFLGLCRQAEVPANYVVIEQGERGRHMFAVMSGKLKVTRKAKDHDPVWMADVKPGDIFGELALVDYGERSASVTTVEPSRLLRFDRMDVIKLQPSLVAKLYRNVGNLMAHRLRATNSVVTVLLAEKQSAEDEKVQETEEGSGLSIPQQRTVIRR